MKLTRLIFVCGVFFLATSVTLAVSVGQTDDFQDGTTQGWGSGFPNPNPPVNIATGGPLGAGDRYLEISANGGVGAGSRLIAFNTTQWSGDYATPSINLITAELNNLSATPLTMRLAIDGAGGKFSSTVGVALPAFSGWTPVEFGFSASNFTASVGGLDINATLSSVSVLRILHNTVPDFNAGPSVLATLGVDNITALLRGDVTVDGFVGGTDLATIISNWGQSPATRDEGDLSGVQIADELRLGFV